MINYKSCRCSNTFGRLVNNYHAYKFKMHRTKLYSPNAGVNIGN